MNNKHITLLSLLLFCGITNLFAQMQNQQIGGIGNTQNNTYTTNNYFTNKKELSKLENEVKQIKLGQDSIMLALKKSEQERAKIDSIYSKNIAQRDSAYLALNRNHEVLLSKYNTQEDSISNRNQHIAQLERIIQIQKKNNFAPFGIKQFKNNQKALGYTLLISEIAVPVALGVGFESAANHNYKQYKNHVAQTLSDHNDYYKKYKNYHQAAIWAPIAAGVLIYGVNVLCNYYCPVKNKDIVFYPTSGFDHQGNAQIGLAMSFKF